MSDLYCGVCNTRCDPICRKARAKRGLLNPEVDGGPMKCTEEITKEQANPRQKQKRAKRFVRRDRDEESDE